MPAKTLWLTVTLSTEEIEALGVGKPDVSKVEATPDGGARITVRSLRPTNDALVEAAGSAIKVKVPNFRPRLLKTVMGCQWEEAAKGAAFQWLDNGSVEVALPVDRSMALWAFR